MPRPAGSILEKHHNDRVRALIRAERESLGWTQSAMASALGFKSVSSYSQYECGGIPVSLRLLFMLADLFGEELVIEFRERDTR